MSSFFEEKVVIITGASKGIGRTTAIMFAAKGARLTLAGRCTANMQITREQCIKAGASSEGILEVFGDIEMDKTREEIVAETIRRFGRIDVLVNNAGLAMKNRSSDPMHVSLEDFDRTITVNTRAVLHLSKLALPYLEKAQGCIINVSSIASLSLTQMNLSYAMSKAALDQLTVQLAGNLAKRGIRVNGVNPGPTQTHFLGNYGLNEDKCRDVITSLGKHVPLGRSGFPEDVAKLIVFLADRNQSEFIVGQRIVIDGGLILNNPLGSKL